LTLPQFAAAQTETPSLEAEAVSILNQYEQPTDTASQLRYLESLLPNPARRQRIADLIVKLGSKSFAVRQASYADILDVGLEARMQLVDAAKSKDLEVRFRAEELIATIDSDGELDKRESLTRAALMLIRHRREVKALPLLLNVAAETDDSVLYDSLSETVWACVSQTSLEEDLVELLQNIVNGKTASIENEIRRQAISIVALELTIENKSVDIAAVERIEAYLKSKDERLRLAAARALVDRQPQTVAKVLIELLSSKRPEIFAQAQALLKSIFTEIPAENFEADETQSLADVWRDWADQHLEDATAKKLGLARLDLSHGRGFLDETFAVASGDVTKGYRRFQYQSGLPTKATVKDGRLRLFGNQGETDQRLCITSKKLTGQREWPRVVQVNAKLTGEMAGVGGYHIGVSVGDIKAVFHPTYNGGGFRIETVDSHDYLVTNTNMGFTPSAAAMHDMKMTVTRTATGAKIDVEVIEGEGAKTKFAKSFLATKKQLGEYNRIGLERSGRSGGAAIFDRVTVRLRP